MWTCRIMSFRKRLRKKIQISEDLSMKMFKGRIVMDIKKKFIVYGSRKLIEDNQFKKAVIAEFSLPKEQTVFKQDFHYEDPTDLEISFK